jgi:hypothetical protein
MEGKGNNIKAAEFRGMMLERTGIILKELESVQKTVEEHTKSIERLKIKASLWGFLAGAIPALTAAIIMIMR